ncbi:ATP-binding protein [Candidatus Bipolaricaulota bacterium]|nr:ATP-binding protein [Candidatus Bipolaricaulota bacterium]
MRIAVASGKGGTGKTTVAVNLALSLSAEESIQFLDCDVEEPNAHIFLKPNFDTVQSVDKLLPQINSDKCTRCGTCVEACEFNALAIMGGNVMLYDSLCHGCGRCGLVCPTGAISEIPHQLGVVEIGTARGFSFARGLLNVGETMATPIIHALKREIDDSRLTILDAPPGTGCPTIAALHEADVALMVTEPTPFGLHDLKAAVEVARTLDVPTAVVINRAGIGNDQVEKYCNEENIPIVLTIPFDRAIAESYAVGTPLVDAVPSWQEQFVELAERLKDVAR